MQDGVVGEVLAYGSSLIMASCGYLGGENGEYDGFVADEVGGEVWLDFGFEGLDFILGYVEIAFASCHVAQELDDLVGASVVLEVVSYDVLAEVLIGGVADGDVSWLADGGVGADVAVEPIEVLVALHEVVYHGGEGVWLAVYVGVDAAAVAYETSVGGVRFFLQGVWEGLDAAVVVVLVGLDTSSAGDVVA